MKNKLFKVMLLLLVLCIGIASGAYLRHNTASWSFIKTSITKLRNNQKEIWHKNFEEIEITSSIDNTIQKAYLYTSTSRKPQPLVVSLHTWSGDYKQYDALAELSMQKDVNYIHPNFRGPNNTIQACCSDLVISDIDDAISYAIKNSNIDTENIFIIGLSGGGYATLSAFMKSKHNIKKFSAWASISDLTAWYDELNIRNIPYTIDILKCTGSENELNLEAAKSKSPLFWKTPIKKFQYSELSIYAGVYDGTQGSVPISHSINFYNKLLNDLSVKDTSKYVSDTEKLKLMAHKKTSGTYSNIADRDIFLKKEFDNLNLTIFRGNHEMLSEYALNELLKQ